MELIEVDKLKKSEDGAAILLHMVIDTFGSDYDKVKNELLLDIEWWIKERERRINEAAERTNKHMAGAKDNAG